MDLGTGTAGTQAENLLVVGARVHVVMHGSGQGAAQQQLAALLRRHGRQINAVVQKGVHAHRHVGGMDSVVVWILVLVASLDGAKVSAHLFAIDSH